MLLQFYLAQADDSPFVSYPVALLMVTIFGAVIGSFLNVVIHRLPLDESIVFPNSRCPKCGAASIEK